MVENLILWFNLQCGLMIMIKYCSVKLYDTDYENLKFLIVGTTIEDHVFHNAA